MAQMCTSAGLHRRRFALQEIKRPRWQILIADKRAQLLEQVQREAPQAEYLCSEVDFKLVVVDQKYLLRYVFRGSTWPRRVKLFPALVAAAGPGASTTAAAAGGDARSGVTGWTQERASSQQLQASQRLSKPSSAMGKLVPLLSQAAPGGSRQAAKSPPTGTRADLGSKKRSCPSGSHHGGGDDEQARKRRRVENCRASHREHVQLHAPEALRLFDAQVRPSRPAPRLFLARAVPGRPEPSACYARQHARPLHQSAPVAGPVG